MKFKKYGDDRHGPQYLVSDDDGNELGRITKWHGLFIAHYPGVLPRTDLHDTRAEAAAHLTHYREREGVDNAS